jgi:type II secretion system protein I
MMRLDAAAVSNAQVGRVGADARCRGLSLLEVMLAIAILGGTLALIGEAMRFAARNAEVAKAMTTAQILCETKMAEITTGLLPPQTTTSVPLEELGTEGEWQYSIQVEQVDQQNMIAVWLTVEQNPGVISRPVNFTLVRWMIDPQTAAQGETQSSSGATGTNVSPTTTPTSPN